MFFFLQPEAQRWSDFSVLSSPITVLMIAVSIKSFAKHFFKNFSQALGKKLFCMATKRLSSFRQEENGSRGAAQAKEGEATRSPDMHTDVKYTITDACASRRSKQ